MLLVLLLLLMVLLLLLLLLLLSLLFSPARVELHMATSICHHMCCSLLSGRARQLAASRGPLVLAGRVASHASGLLRWLLVVCPCCCCCSGPGSVASSCASAQVACTAVLQHMVMGTSHAHTMPACLAPALSASPASVHHQCLAAVCVHGW